MAIGHKIAGILILCGLLCAGCKQSAGGHESSDEPQALAPADLSQSGEAQRGGVVTTPAPASDPNRALAMEEAAASRSPYVGKQAPDFTLPDAADVPIKLSSLRGSWVVLYFYPKDDTPGCACQATEFTKLLTDFRKVDARIFGVSTDSTLSHRQFITKYHLRIELLSDPDHRVMAEYGAWAQVGEGSLRTERVIRTTFIIDPQGAIRYHWPEVIPLGHAQRVEAKLIELQHASPV